MSVKRIPKFIFLSGIFPFILAGLLTGTIIIADQALAQDRPTLDQILQDNVGNQTIWVDGNTVTVLICNNSQRRTQLYRTVTKNGKQVRVYIGPCKIT